MYKTLLIWLYVTALFINFNTNIIYLVFNNSVHFGQLWTKLVVDIILWTPSTLWLLVITLLLFLICEFCWYFIMHSWWCSHVLSLSLCLLSHKACIIMNYSNVRNYLNTSSSLHIRSMNTYSNQLDVIFVSFSTTFIFEKITFQKPSYIPKNRCTCKG